MPRPEYDAHHVIHHERDWQARPQAKLIRENRWLIPPLERSAHEELHANCPPVPLLGYHALTYVARNFEAVPEDYVASLQRLMRTIELSSERPNVHRLEKALADIAVESLSLQEPWIKEGLYVDMEAA